MDVICIRNDGVALGLNLSKAYLLAPYKVLEKVCNGIGPAWFPDWVRDKVTDYFEYFLPSTNQHDFDFEFLFKSNFNFKLANDRLCKNMLIQIGKDTNLSYWSFSKSTSKWRKKLQARFLYKMCVKYGEDAFFTEGIK